MNPVIAAYEVMAEGVEDTLPKPANITIGNTVVKTFPYATQFTGSAAIKVSKTGGLPVYFTAYQQHWNTAPHKVSGDFTVTTFFQKNNDTINRLKAGEPVVLQAKVMVKADADYVMIEIPIPAGCSYKDKAQSRSNNEVHREYFKNKVSIFCTSLPRGTYTFSIALLPRYSSTYTLNPAKAGLMYFPVFYSREEIKKVRIE